MKDRILVGYEVGSGEAVEVPVAHTVVCGQTQLSGKTTTLEAMVVRSGARALAFRTKRGERAFEKDNLRNAGGELHHFVYPIPPYFRERADWRFVSAILEATLAEKMRFERSWIVRACKGARTLADVRRNLTKLETKAGRGMSGDIYMLLGEYLDIVIPVIGKIEPTAGVQLREGVNVVDLVGYPVEVQGLVIASMLQWVHEHESGVVCLLPESWKFIPQGRNSPALIATRSLAREGAGIKNLVWIDSQDLAGVEKEIVRACSVYVLGVQREMNEVKRTLAHIPAGIKRPKADEIATLRRGEFFACFGSRAVRTYVCPAWLSPATAKEAARLLTFDQIQPPHVHPRPPVTVEEILAPITPPPNQETDEMSHETNTRLDRLTDVLERVCEKLVKPMTTIVTSEVAIPPGVGRQDHEREDKPGKAVGAPPAGRAHLDEDGMFDRFVARLKQEAPALIKTIAMRAELQVSIERRQVSYEGGSIKSKIAALYAGGFFKEGHTAAETAVEVNRRNGGNTIAARCWDALEAMTRDGLFFVEAKRYTAVPGVKVTTT